MQIYSNFASHQIVEKNNYYPDRHEKISNHHLISCFF